MVTQLRDLRIIMVSWESLSNVITEAISQAFINTLNDSLLQVSCSGIQFSPLNQPTRLNCYSSGSNIIQVNSKKQQWERAAK